MQTAPKIDEFLTWLERFVKGRPGVNKVVVYGSFARGNATDISDIDLAVDLADPNQWPEIAEEIRKNPVTLRKLDLVCLNTTSRALKLKIKQEGRILYERNQ